MNTVSTSPFVMPPLVGPTAPASLAGGCKPVSGMAPPAIAPVDLAPKVAGGNFGLALLRAGPMGDVSEKGLAEVSASRVLLGELGRSDLLNLSHVSPAKYLHCKKVKDRQPNGDPCVSDKWVMSTKPCDYGVGLYYPSLQELSRAHRVFRNRSPQFKATVVMQSIVAGLLSVGISLGSLMHSAGPMFVTICAVGSTEMFYGIMMGTIPELHSSADKMNVHTEVPLHNRLVELGLFKTELGEKTRWRHGVQAAARALATGLAERAFADESDSLKESALRRLWNTAELRALRRFDHIVRPVDIAAALAIVAYRRNEMDKALHALTSAVQDGSMPEDLESLLDSWREDARSRADVRALFADINERYSIGVKDRWIHPLADLRRSSKKLGPKEVKVFLQNFKGSELSPMSYIVSGMKGLWGIAPDAPRWVAMGDGVAYSASAVQLDALEEDIDAIEAILRERLGDLPGAVLSYSQMDLHRLAHELWIRRAVLMKADAKMKENLAFKRRSDLGGWLIEEAERILDDGESGDVTGIAGGRIDTSASMLSLPAEKAVALPGQRNWIDGLSLYNPSRGGLAGPWRRAIQGGAELLAGILSRLAFAGEGVEEEKARQCDLMGLAREFAIEAKDHVVRADHVMGALELIGGKIGERDLDDLLDGGVPKRIQEALGVWRQSEGLPDGMGAWSDLPIVSHYDIERFYTATHGIRTFMSGIDEMELGRVREVLSPSGSVTDEDATLFLWELLLGSGLDADGAVLANSDALLLAAQDLNQNAEDEHRRVYETWERHFGIKEER